MKGCVHCDYSCVLCALMCVVVFVHCRLAERVPCCAPLTAPSRRLSSAFVQLTQAAFDNRELLQGTVEESPKEHSEKGHVVSESAAVLTSPSVGSLPEVQGVQWAPIVEEEGGQPVTKRSPSYRPSPLRKSSKASVRLDDRLRTHSHPYEFLCDVCDVCGRHAQDVSALEVQQEVDLIFKEVMCGCSCFFLDLRLSVYVA